MRALVLSFALLLTTRLAAAQPVDSTSGLDDRNVQGGLLGAPPPSSKPAKYRIVQSSELKIGTPKMKDSGVLNKGAIRRNLSRKQPELRSCHSPSMPAGNVVVDLAIDLDGLVSSVSARGVSADVAACVQGVIDGIAFPQPKAALKARVTLTYRVVSGRRADTDFGRR